MVKFHGSSFCAATGVSDGTFEKLSLYMEKLLKWQARFNLVGSSTLKDAWRRHMFDSSQIFGHIDDVGGRVLDLGSGAGFPGLVLSIMGLPNVVLLESNEKKCSFLREVIRETACSAEVFNGRIEDYPEFQSAKYITSRALAPLGDLLLMSYPLLASGGKCLFLKGHRYEEELTPAKKKWSMEVSIHPSNTNDVYLKRGPSGVLIAIRDLSPSE